MRRVEVERRARVSLCEYVQPVWIYLYPPVRVPRVTVCNGKRFFRPSWRGRPILGPRNIVSRVQPGTKGKEKEKEKEREREREREEKKNESVQAGRMERREPFDTRSATKRTCCGRITVHIYLLFRTRDPLSFFCPLIANTLTCDLVFPRVVVEYRIVRRKIGFSNSVGSGNGAICDFSIIEGARIYFY